MSGSGRDAAAAVRAFKRGVRAVLPDRVVAVRTYRAVHGRWPSLFRPVTFSEKVLFRKNFDRRPILALFHDKLRVRDYVAERLGADMLPPLLLVTERPETIPFDDLPDRFVIKPSHASGLVAIVTDRRTLDRAAAIAQCHGWLRHDYYRQTREWMYRQLPRRIMVEAFIDQGTGGTPNDYKFYVFDGKVRIIQMDVGRFAGHRQGFFDTGWRRLAFALQYEPIRGAVAPPTHLDRMIAAAERLGEGMDFIRVDLYDTDRQCYFGEITTCPGSGLDTYHPPGFDHWLGAFWHLAKTRR